MRKMLLILMLSVFSAGCATDDVLTKKELETQSKADAIVSGVLFDHELEQAASYNVRKDGSVVLKFADSVHENVYTPVVDKMRAMPGITSVYAEQNGVEVCALR